MDSITLTVTGADIAAARRQSATRCPVALAAAGTFGFPVGWALAFPGWLTIHDPSRAKMRAYRLPAEASAFIEAFDRGAPVAPFMFTACSREG